jgi:DNA-binding NarL/FixJ family response regulator
MPQDIRVTIFEDNYLLRDSYYQLVNGTPGFTCVGSYDSAKDLVFKIKLSKPDVILMDIDMPGIDGIEAAGIVKRDFPDIHVIMQTVFEDDDKIFAAILAGASGYILKKTPPAKMLDAIADVCAGGAPMTPIIAGKVLKLFRKGVKPLSNPRETELNVRQHEILECIVAGMSYKMIADKLFISLDTVRYHVKNIYDILQIHSKYELFKKHGK